MHHRGVSANTTERVWGKQCTLQKIIERPGLACLRLRAIALARHTTRLHNGLHSECDNCHKHTRRNTGADAMPCQESSKAIGHARWSRHNRFRPQVSLDVQAQFMRRLVPVTTVGGHGLEGDPIKIAAKVARP